MRRLRPTLSILSLVIASAVFAACESVPIVDTGPGSVPPAGVVQGTVVYQGPHPCSMSGHIVGNAIVLFFDQNNPPPPNGLASTALNFGVVSGESLFVNEPRAASSTLYCPVDHGITDTITVSAPFAVSPFAAGTYIAEAFFDTAGDFLPTFKFRELPERGDVAGGYIDTTDALMHTGDINYQPIFLPIRVGVPSGSAEGDAAAPLRLPATGYDANNVTISIGEVLPLARPYFYPALGTAPAPAPAPDPENLSGNVNYVPVATMAQDLHVLAPPSIGASTPTTVQKFQDSFVKITLNAGVPPSELAAATSPSGPFHFQLGANQAKSLEIWGDTDSTMGGARVGIPENSLIPSLFPQVVFTRLVDDPAHTRDPQSLLSQGPPSANVIVSIGITLPASDSLYDASTTLAPTAPGPGTASDHVTALVRPTVVCVNPDDPGAGATLVTPFLTGTSADPTVTGQVELFNPSRVIAALQPIFGTVTVKQACLPPGRFAINLVYPTGQAWTVPNESGGCATSEGTIKLGAQPTCSVAPPGAGGQLREVLYSQGPRGVLEITESPGSATCAMFPVPPECGPKAAAQ